MTNINQGILEANVAAALGAIATAVNVGPTSTLQLNSSGVTYAAKALTLEGTGNGLNPAGLSNFLLNRGALNNQAGTNTWTGNITLAAPPPVGSQSGTLGTTNFGLAGGNLTINGTISGANNLTVAGASSDTLTLNGQNTFSGNLEIDLGTVVLSNTNTYGGTTSIGGTSSKLTLNQFGTATTTTAISVAPTATLAIDNSAVSISNRFGANNKPNLALNGANFTLTGSNAPGFISTETLGNISLVGGNSIITQTSGAGLSAAMILNVTGNLTRTAGSGATVNFAAGGINTATYTKLGSQTNQINIAGFTSSLSNSTLASSGFTGSAGNLILPYAVVSNNSTTAAPTDLTTYGTTGITAFASGLGTPNNQAYATTLETALPGSNVMLTASDSIATNRTVNAIVFDGATAATPFILSIAGGTTLTVASGQILSNTNLPAAGTTTITGGSLSVGSAEALIFTNTSTTTVFDTPITGSNGMTLSGTGSLTFGGRQQPHGLQPHLAERYGRHDQQQHGLRLRAAGPDRRHDHACQAQWYWPTRS